MRKTIPQIDDALRAAINTDGKKGKRRMAETWKPETLDDLDDVTTDTLVVTGGTLVRTIVWDRDNDKPISVAVVFFPGVLIR